MLKARTDANQTEIVKALRSIGASVTVLSSVGKGVPDILVGFKGINLLMEIKDGNKPPSARKLTPDEMQWHSTWNGQKAVVNNVDEAIQLVCNTQNGVIKNRYS